MKFLKRKKAHNVIIFLAIAILLISSIITSAQAISGTNIASEIVTFIINQKPSMSSVSMLPSSGNTTTDFTCDVSGSDGDSDSLSYTYFWTKDDQGPVLLMTFDKNISSNITGAVQDISGNNNNGTLGDGNLSKAPNWISSGQSGGAYSFDGDNDFVNIPNLPINFPISVTYWVKTSDKTATGVNIFLYFGGNYFASGFYSSGFISSIPDKGASLIYFTNDEWSFITVVQKSTSELNVYVNGINRTSTVSGQFWSKYGSISQIGARASQTNFQGSIDDVRIYTRALGEAEIQDLYEETAQLLNHDATSKEEDWTCSAVAYDGYEYSTVSTSDVTTIQNLAPEKPKLMIPTNGNMTLFDRKPMFFWNTTDTDGDSLDFILNITHPDFPDYIYLTDSVNATQNNTIYNWSIPDELLVDYECGNVNYTWKVKAYDGTNYSEWSDDFQFMIESSVIVTPNETMMNFGALDLLQVYDTLNNTPTPFIFENRGNVKIDLKNLTLVPTDSQFWVSQGLSKEFLQFKVDNHSIEDNSFYNSSFSYTNSTTTWTNFSEGNNYPMKLLDYHNGSNFIEIDLRLKVPGDEPPVQTSKTFNFEWSLTD